MAQDHDKISRWALAHGFHRNRSRHTPCAVRQKQSKHETDTRENGSAGASPSRASYISCCSWM